MLFNYSCPLSKETYSFDVVFNELDFSIQVEIDNKLYNEVFTLEEIRSHNNFFDSMDLLKNIIVQSLNKKDGFNMTITTDKTLKLKFVVTTPLSKSIEFLLDILPVRKEISNSSEVMELKRKIKLLESCISNKIILSGKILTPINSAYTGPICFSSEITNDIQISYRHTYIAPRVDTRSFIYDILADNGGSVCSNPNSYKFTKLLVHNLYIGKYTGYLAHTGVINTDNHDTFVNYHIIDTKDFLFPEMKRLCSNKIAFYNCELSADLYKYMPSELEKIYLINVCIKDDEGYGELLSRLVDKCTELSSIVIYNGIDKVDDIYIDIISKKRTIHLSLYGKKPSSYNKERLSSNIVIDRELFA